MEHKELCQLWIKYLRESNFRKDKGEAAFQSYVKRIKTIAKEQRLTPFPTVRKISDIIEQVIDQTYSETSMNADPPFDLFRKKLIQNIRFQERTSLLLHIHCPGIPPRGGQKAVLQEVGKLIKEKLSEIKTIREFYLTWTAPGERVVPELKMYLELYQKRKRGATISSLQEVAYQFAKNIGSQRLSQDEEPYLAESQISRAIGYAKQILRNVEKGIFPGNYN